MKLFGRKRARAKLNEVLRGHEPPTFPQGVMRLLKLLRDPDSEISEIAEALQWDPGLVVRVLKTVNSAAYGSARKIDCVQHAVSMMGRSQLEQLVLGIAVKGSLPTKPAPGYDAPRYWQAAFFRAALARSIAGKLHPADQARSFTGGLLQDMAVPLLAHARPDDYGPVLVEWHGDRKSNLHELERSALGWSHDEIGGHLGEEWELPASLSSVIQQHHAEGANDAELPPALRLVATHRETEREAGIDAMVEEGRSMYGLEPDWVLASVVSSEAQALELAQAL
ncbi:MAG: HDOD domain-containing protein [bacterium]|nr:HDOD domain-containing protein [bacterium]